MVFTIRDDRIGIISACPMSGENEARIRIPKALTPISSLEAEEDECELGDRRTPWIM
jgi:hypothetical protein